MERKKVRIERWREGAFYPEKATKGSYAYDLRAVTPLKADGVTRETIIIRPMQADVISTGLHFYIPEDECVHILPKSGLACPPRCITVWNSPGLIDEDFSMKSGANHEDFDIRVILYNGGQSNFEVTHGLKIAQAEPSNNMIFVDEEGNEIEPLNKERTGGFGSTGTH